MLSQTGIVITSSLILFAGVLVIYLGYVMDEVMLGRIIGGAGLVFVFVSIWGYSLADGYRAHDTQSRNITVKVSEKADVDMLIANGWNCEASLMNGGWVCRNTLSN